MLDGVLRSSALLMWKPNFLSIVTPENFESQKRMQFQIEHIREPSNDKLKTLNITRRRFEIERKTSQ